MREATVAIFHIASLSMAAKMERGGLRNRTRLVALFHAHQHHRHLNTRHSGIIRPAQVVELSTQTCLHLLPSFGVSLKKTILRHMVEGFTETGR